MPQQPQSSSPPQTPTPSPQPSTAEEHQIPQAPVRPLPQTSGVDPAPPPTPGTPAETSVESLKVAKPKVGRNVLVCSLYALILFLVLLAGVLFLIAKTGLVTIPLASHFYNGTQPTRQIEAGAMDPERVLDRISLSVSSAIQQGKSGPFVVEITEEELTAAARGGMTDLLKDQRIIAERTQVVITPEFAEASSLLRTPGANLDLLMRFV
ncbi:hypothetical protein GF380_02470, partial [Candidatus Uhrbacteria bacterium]|nr:hypothetical protein [Candidatus Uhrbacteria bacterium]MBD3284054.1 hypothetical protein [Candidatus Uhrbacteria bacterium]